MLTTSIPNVGLALKRHFVFDVAFSLVKMFKNTEEYPVLCLPLINVHHSLREILAYVVEFQPVLSSL